MAQELHRHHQLDRPQGRRHRPRRRTWGSETAAVAAGPFGSVFYARNNEEGQSELRVRDRNGAIRTFADLGTYEATQNPDQVTTYGIDGGLSPECEAQWPSDQAGSARPTRPGRLAPVRAGHDPVRRAGRRRRAANAILFVDWTGPDPHRRRAAPTAATLITADAAAANGLPECVVGRSYNFEPVPTDLELGPRAELFVSSLPGGPEDPSLGARGGVFRVNPWNGRSTLIATGFLGASNLAVSPDGTIFVTELFGNRMSRVAHGGPVPVADLTQAAAIEWSKGGRPGHRGHRGLGQGGPPPALTGIGSTGTVGGGACGPRRARASGPGSGSGPTGRAQAARDRRRRPIADHQPPAAAGTASARVAAAPAVPSSSRHTTAATASQVSAAAP